jgi:hypothetical protein
LRNMVRASRNDDASKTSHDETISPLASRA